ncbi:MAG: thiolase domain-containing protein, partial [Nitrospinota bacterium]
MKAHIIGFGHTKFANHKNKDLEDLIVEVTKEALDDSNVDAKDIDEIFLGNFNEGFVNQGFPSSLVMQNQPDFQFKPIHRLENACSTGSAAVQAAARAVRSGEVKRA